MVTIPATITHKTIQPDIGVMSIVIWVQSGGGVEDATVNG